MLFRTMFEKAPIGIALISDYFYVESANSTFEDIVGRDLMALRTVTWKEMTHEEDLAKDLEYFNRLINGEINAYSMEKRYIRPDGQPIWVEMNIIRFEPDHNSHITHLCLIQSINQRKAAEQKLLESERSKSVLLSNLPGMAFRCKNDRKWTVEYVSEGAYVLTGYMPEEMIGPEGVAFSEIIEPEYRDLLYREWQRVLESHGRFKNEYQIKTKQGQSKWVLELGQGHFDRQGNVIALEGIIIDMTDRKDQEKRIEYLNRHDFLTGLYNRQYFEKEKNRHDNLDNLPITFMICDIDGLRLINDGFGHAYGDQVIEETAGLLKGFCDERDILARTGGNEFCFLFPQTNEEDAYRKYHRIIEGIEHFNESTHRLAIDLSIAIGYSVKKSEAHSMEEVVREAMEYMYNRKMLSQQSSHSSILSSIMTTMFEKSQETEVHAKRLSELSIAVGRKLSLSQNKLDEMKLFAMLHDIGKVGIDDRILNKPDKLTADEWQVMKKHPEIGYRIAKSSPEFEKIADLILSHHERWDGKGYPRGLSGEQIPLQARILSVVDAYDAMTEDRVYRKALSREEAINELVNNKATQFDPIIVDIFLELIANKA